MNHALEEVGEAQIGRILFKQREGHHVLLRNELSWFGRILTGPTVCSVGICSVAGSRHPGPNYADELILSTLGLLSSLSSYVSNSNGKRHQTILLNTGDMGTFARLSGFSELIQPPSLIASLAGRRHQRAFTAYLFSAITLKKTGPQYNSLEKLVKYYLLEIHNG